MLSIHNKKTQLDELLDNMAEEIQLDDSRYNRMKKQYEAVKNWIEDDEVFFKPYKYDVYPHGSVRILTTVRPLARDEFDLDIAIHLKTEWNSHTPAKIYNELKRRLEQNETYKKILELKNRCIRLNFSGDFHMDILPGIQASLDDENTLRVPDRELGTWVISNPKGYAEWFMSRTNLVQMSLLERAMNAEKLPTDNFKYKKPLQRGVQLIKRYRDIYFQNDDTFKTSSIVLTTIAGLYYNGEESIFETVDNIITSIRNNITSTPKRIVILNPVNSEEDFTDKWEEEPRYYDAFQKFCDYLYVEWQKLKKENGVIEESNILKGLFGENLLKNAQNKQAQSIELLRNSRNLGISNNTGILIPLESQTPIESPTIAIQKNTFFGD